VLSSAQSIAEYRGQRRSKEGVRNAILVDLSRRAFPRTMQKRLTVMMANETVVSMTMFLDLRRRNHVAPMSLEVSIFEGPA